MNEVINNTIVKFDPASLVENTSVKVSDANMLVVSDQQMISTLKTEQKIDNMLSRNHYQQKVMASNISYSNQTSELMPKGSPTFSKQNKEKSAIQVD